jgi:hypothetical protein
MYIERERDGEVVWWEEAQMGSASKGAPLKVLVGSPSRVAPLKCQEQPCCTYVHVKCMHAPMELMLALLLQQPQVHHIYIYTYVYVYIYIYIYTCACGGRRHMWAVQAKLLVGLLGGLLLSSIRSNPCTHTHMQVPHTCMHACMGIN